MLSLIPITFCVNSYSPYIPPQKQTEWKQEGRVGLHHSDDDGDDDDDEKENINNADQNNNHYPHHHHHHHPVSQQNYAGPLTRSIPRL